MNFILDQEEKVKQLEEYMGVIGSDFVQLSSEVVVKLKEEIRMEEDKAKKIEKITSHGLNASFFESIYSDPFSGPQWANLFQISERVYRELFREFFASIEFESTACRYDPEYKGVKFRAETVKANHVLLGFWPSIRDGEFFVGGTSMNEVRDPNVRLAHRCIATTISGRKDSTQRIIEIDLFYLYYIYAPWVVCNIPYGLTKYLKGVRDKNFICGGMFVTRIARSFGLLTAEIVDVLSVEPPVHIFKKKSLIVMGIVMDLHGGACYWPASHEAGKVMRLTRRLRRTLVDQQTCKGIRVYKFNLDYMASIKWVVEIPFNARVLYSTNISFSRLVNLLEVKHFISNSVNEINIVQLRIVSQAGLKLLQRSSLATAPPHKLK
ncbi:hypothetical protein Tco_0386895 [Tanacetum coccineum]